MRVIFHLAMFIALCASTASAQVSFANIQEDDDEYHKAEVFVGYSHNRVNVDFIGGSGFNGFNASVTGNFSRLLVLKFDFSGHYRSRDSFDASTYNAHGGVQLKDNSRTARFKPFAHLLAGVARRKSSFGTFGEFTDTGFSAIAGGGLDIRAGSRFDIRVGQVDYNLTRFGGQSEHNLRLGVGLVFH